MRKQDGLALMYATFGLKADKEVVPAAFKTYGSALEWAAEELQADKDVVLAAVKCVGDALAWASDALKADKEVVIEALKQYGDDKEEGAVKQCGWALQHPLGGLQVDKEVVLAAVKQNGRALKYAAEALKSDALLLRLARLPNRGRRNWHVFKVRFTVRAAIAYWSMLAGKDDTHFDEDGRAVMAGSGALAAKLAFGEMMMPNI